jgi:hypothetical protein
MGLLADLLAADLLAFLEHLPPSVGIRCIALLKQSASTRAEHRAVRCAAPRNAVASACRGDP